MKKIILIAAAITFFSFQFSNSYAQRGHRDQQRPDITKFVSNLTDDQKSKLETLTNDSRKRVDGLRAQQKNVRDSISRYMDREGDQSKYLYPLFDREAQLQTAISREMYTTKVRIEKVLPKEQRAEFQKSAKQHRKNKKK